MDVDERGYDGRRNSVTEDTEERKVEFVTTNEHEGTRIGEDSLTADGRG
jgi:hypothetical protein